MYENEREIYKGTIALKRHVFKDILTKFGMHFDTAIAHKMPP